MRAQPALLQAELEREAAIASAADRVAKLDLEIVEKLAGRRADLVGCAADALRDLGLEPTSNRLDDLPAQISRLRPLRA